jgi:hypothetical protein
MQNIDTPTQLGIQDFELSGFVRVLDFDEIYRVRNKMISNDSSISSFIHRKK